MTHHSNCARCGHKHDRGQDRKCLAETKKGYECYCPSFVKQAARRTEDWRLEQLAQMSKHNRIRDAFGHASVRKAGRTGRRAARSVQVM